MREFDGFVFPTFPYYTGWVDINFDKFSRKADNIKISVYSPQNLSPGEMAEFESTLTQKFSQYTGYLEMLSSINGGLLQQGIAMGVTLPLFFMEMLWGGIWILWFVGLDILALPPALYHLFKKRKIKKLLKNFKKMEVTSGKNPQKEKIIKELNEYFCKLSGKEIDIYKKMLNFSRERGFKEGVKFYEQKIKDFQKESLIVENPTLLRPTIFNIIKFLIKRPDLRPPRIEFPMREMREQIKEDFPLYENHKEGTALKAYQIPLKEGYTMYIPPSPFSNYIFPPVIPRLPPLHLPLDKEWYLHEVRKDKAYLKLAVSKFSEEGKLKKKIKEGLHDTVFAQTAQYADYSKQIMRYLMEAYSFSIWVRIIFGGSFFISSGYNITGATAVGAYILYFRPNSTVRISEGFSRYVNRVISGLEHAIEDLYTVEQNYDYRLKKLEEIIRSEPDRIKAYRKAYHSCEKLGLPQLKDYYEPLQIMHEWKFKEPKKIELPEK